MAFYLDTKVVGLKQITMLTANVARDLETGLEGRLESAAELVESSAKSITHSSRVRAAIAHEVKVVSAGNFVARIGPLRKKAFFAHFLELGTKHHPRFPFLEPAVEATEDRVVDLVGKIPSLGF